MAGPETHKFITQEHFKRKSSSVINIKPTYTGDERKFVGVKNGPKTKYQKNSEDSEDFKKSKFHSC